MATQAGQNLWRPAPADDFGYPGGGFVLLARMLGFLMECVPKVYEFTWGHHRLLELALPGLTGQGFEYKEFAQFTSLPVQIPIRASCWRLSQRRIGRYPCDAHKVLTAPWVRIENYSLMNSAKKWLSDRGTCLQSANLRTVDFSDRTPPPGDGCPAMRSAPGRTRGISPGRLTSFTPDCEGLAARRIWLAGWREDSRACIRRS